MPIGKLALKGLGRLGGGLSSVVGAQDRNSPPPPPVTGNLIIKENNTGYVLLENSNKILTE